MMFKIANDSTDQDSGQHDPGGDGQPEQGDLLIPVVHFETALFVVADITVVPAAIC